MLPFVLLMIGLASPSATTISSSCDPEQLAVTAQAFFDACEYGKGWNVSRAFVDPTAGGGAFTWQVTGSLPGPKYAQINNIMDYTNWMVGVVKEFGAAATVDVKARGVSGLTVIYYAVFGGVSDYVYVLTMSEFNAEEPTSSCKVKSVTKIWNDGYAAKHPPKL